MVINDTIPGVSMKKPYLNLSKRPYQLCITDHIASLPDKALNQIPSVQVSCVRCLYLTIWLHSYSQRYIVFMWMKLKGD
ncbi:MAG: hypothetical protein V3T79_03180, partial [Candidatus Scalindua sediminis]